MAKNMRRHRLLVYYRLGQRWRTVPLLMAVLGGILYGLAWLNSYNIVQGLNTDLLNRIWTNRIMILILIGTSLLLYILTLFIAHFSYVKVRGRALRIRAGLVPQDISYGRINQLRLVQLSKQYPPESLKNSEYAILEPLYGEPCTAVDLNSWPNAPLKKLWHRFMFTQEGGSLLLIVDDAMLLNQQIDAALIARKTRLDRKGGYQDPVKRAADQAGHSRGR